MISTTFFSILALAATSFGCVPYLPPQSLDVTTIPSSYVSGAEVTYKNTTICETTPGVRSFSGYVHLPPNTTDTQPYPAHFFFWFFEARKNPQNAPLVVWINGGPGASSLLSVASENGPCYINADSNSTTLNPFSWNNEVNMLYVDSPIQTGYSYDVLTNVTVNYLTGEIVPTDLSTEMPQINETFVVGTLGSQDPSGTANTTQNAAIAFWDFAQVWFTAFSEYMPQNNKIHLWTESFGGKYGPSFTSYFHKQSDKIVDGKICDKPSIPIHFESLGIINGCSDAIVQDLGYPEMAFNNTYGIEAISEEVYQAILYNQTQPDGCTAKVETCRSLAAKLDPENNGFDPQVNEACIEAQTVCYSELVLTIKPSGRDTHDLRQINYTNAPPPYLEGFFNQHWVQAELGVPVNFSGNSLTVLNAFMAAGDGLTARDGPMEQFHQILDDGTRVAFVYGDSDFLCNWIGAEHLSLAIDHKDASGFRSSGYAAVQVNESYVGGVVRQSGNMSFTRVFDAGHQAPAFQPETVYDVFMRSMNSKDLATGSITLTGSNSSSYHTEGPASAFGFKNKSPARGPPICYLYGLVGSCTENQLLAVSEGSAVFKDFVVVDPAE